MRQLITLLFIATIALPSLAAQIRYNLPHIANGEFGVGELERRITTTFVLFNNTNSVAGVTIRLSDDPGDPLSVTIAGLGTASSFDVVLQPGETLFLQTDGAGALAAGSARVISTVDIGVSAIFTIQDNSGGFITEAGVGASSGKEFVTLPVDATGNFSTGVGVQNLTDQTNTIDFRLFSATGEAEDDRKIEVPPNGHVGIFVTGPGGLFPDLGSFQGVLQMDSRQQFAAVTLRQNLDPLSFTTLPVVDTNSTQRTFVLPQIASGGGILSTTFVVFNLLRFPGSATISTTLDSGEPWELSYAGGQGTTSELTVNVPGNGVVFVQTDGTGPVQSGAASIVSTRNFGVAAIYTLTEGGAFKTETGVGDSPGLLVGSFPMDTRGGFETGIAIFNRQDSAIDVAATLFPSGQLPAGGALTKTIQIEPNGHTAQLVGTDLFPGQSGLVGNVSLTSTSEFAAVSIRQNADPLAFTTLPVANGAFADFGGGGTNDATALAVVETIPDLTTDTTLDVQLPGGFRLSGTVAEGAAPAPAQTIPEFFVFSAVATRSDGARFAGISDLTDPDGYSIAVPPGLYQVEVCYVPIAGVAPAGSQETTSVLSSVTEFVTVSGDTVKDVQVSPPQMTEFSGTIGGLDQVPDLTSIIMILQDQVSNTSALVEVDPDGSYAGMVADVNRLDVHLLLEREDGGDPSGQVSLLSNASEFSTRFGPHDFSLPALATLSGQVTQASQPAPAGGLPDDQVLAILNDLFGRLGSLCVPTIGISNDNLFSLAYDDLVLQAGPKYNLSALLKDQATGGEHVHPWQNVQFFSDVPVVRDFDVPALPGIVILSGTVTGPSGLPLEGAIINATSVDVNGAPGSLFTNYTHTGAGGAYSIQLRVGKNYRIDVAPPIPQGGFPF